MKAQRFKSENKMKKLTIGILFSVLFSITSWGASTVMSWGQYQNYSNTLPYKVVAIAPGSRTTIALREDGVVIGWGDNMFGELNFDSPVVSAKFPTPKDAKVTSFSFNPGGSLSNVVAIAHGNAHCVALKNDGTVVAWGNNFYGQTDVPAGLSNVVAIGAASLHTVAIRRDGSVVAWGENTFGQCSFTPAMAVKQACGGDYFTTLLYTNGTVECIGYNGNGECNVPAGLSNVVKITSAGHNTIALKSDHTVVIWGAYGFSSVQYFQRPPDIYMTNIQSIAGIDHSSFFQTRNGEVVFMGYNDWNVFNIFSSWDTINQVVGNSTTYATLSGPPMVKIQNYTPTKKIVSWPADVVVDQLRKSASLGGTSSTVDVNPTILRASQYVAVDGTNASGFFFIGPSGTNTMASQNLPSNVVLFEVTTNEPAPVDPNLLGSDVGVGVYGPTLSLITNISTGTIWFTPVTGATNGVITDPRVGVPMAPGGNGITYTPVFHVIRKRDLMTYLGTNTMSFPCQSTNEYKVILYHNDPSITNQASQIFIDWRN